MINKTDKLRKRLKKGYSTTPLLAWKWWKMSSSSYHRAIHDMRKCGMCIESIIICPKDRPKYSMHKIVN